MTTEMFVDTGGFYAMLDPNDYWHADAKHRVESPKVKSEHFITTDYVLDETVTLLQTRGIAHVATPWLENLFGSDACTIVWMNADRFDQVCKFFAKHSDKQWSFTDCFSFCVMQERNIRQALVSDKHFRQAGYEPILAS